MALPSLILRNLKNNVREACAFSHELYMDVKNLSEIEISHID